jgi:hypothetical protein
MHDRRHLHRLKRRTGRVVGPEPPAAKRLGNPLHPHVGVKPAVHVKDVPKDEHEGDHAGRPLERIADIGAIAVSTVVGQRAAGHENAIQRVED